MPDIEKVMTEMQTEFFNILGNIKLLLADGKIKTAEQYVDEQYDILKKELADDDQSNN